VTSQHLLTRRRLLLQFAGIAAAATAWRSSAQAQTKVPIVVYKDPSCGCCQQWVEYMNGNGFAVTVKDTSDLNAVKRAQKVAQPLWSCHTALVGNYVIEGHVPAADVKRLLTQQPKGIVGLTIPGMPASAPGMDMKPFVPYTVLTFDATGRTTIFAKHERA
jgi:hypothetical protein